MTSSFDNWVLLSEHRAVGTMTLEVVLCHLSHLDRMTCLGRQDF